MRCSHKTPIYSWENMCYEVNFWYVIVAGMYVVLTSTNIRGDVSYELSKTNKSIWQNWVELDVIFSNLHEDRIIKVKIGESPSIMYEIFLTDDSNTCNLRKNRGFKLGNPKIILFRFSTKVMDSCTWVVLKLNKSERN